MTASATHLGSNLTRNQLLIWTGHRLWPGLPIYNEVAVFVIDGPVERQHFDRAFQLVADRTDVLRMVIEDRDGVPFLRVRDHVAHSPAFVDLSQEVDPDRALEDWVTCHAGIAFDLAQRWYDTALIKLAEDRYAWYFVQHHILTDATSNGILFQRVADCYARLLEGEPGSGTAYPGFLEYLEFERQYRGTSAFTEDEQYWTRKTEGAREPLTFYGVSAETFLSSKAQQRIHHELGTGRSEAIRQLARRSGAGAASEQMAVFSVFAAALFVYLHRISGSDRVTIGVPWRNRPRRFADTAGLLMVQAPFTVSIGPDETFEAVVRKVQEEALEVRQHVPYAVGNPGGKLYSVVLNFQTQSLGSFAGMAVRTSIHHSRVGEGSMALQVHSLGGTGAFAVEFDLNCDVFAPEDRPRVVRHFENVLDACLENPARPVRTIMLLDEGERSLLNAWNGTRVDYPRDRTVVQLFEEQAARLPDAVAVTHAGESLSYRELNARANALAVRLRALGVRPGALVGLCLERSLQMMVGLLATLKAGGAYVPLDPVFPAQRLAFMLEDSQASVLLTQTSLAGLLPVGAVRVVDLDHLAPGDLVDGEDLPPAAGPDDLAYVLYTSGSTGKPKGVEITHRALTNFLCSMRLQPGCDERDVLLAVTTLSFDIAGLELYLPLITGARVELVSREAATDGQLLRERIEQVNPTLLQATPATWRMLIDAGWTGSQGLTALIGGEPLPPGLVQPLLERTRALWNLYGPTETTIWSSVKRVRSAAEQITVGRPIANTTFHVVDKALQPVPIGVAGELLIGGDGLARGYRGRPELTAEKFIADPFSDQPGARLYRTGDLARYRADGDVVHLGRLDHQVKIRGFRIELGEIEAALTACAGIAQTVVDARADHTGAAALVAYLVPLAGQSVSGAELRRSLRHTLPDYMVPQYFVPMQALPLTPNGKVDRNALPAPEAGALGEAQAFVAPRTPLEQTLADIWADVLGCARVGVHENFFDLGGHSLGATRIIARTRRVLGVELPLRALVEAPNVAELAARIGALDPAQCAHAAAGVAPLAPASALSGPLSPAQEALWITERLNGRSDLYHLPQIVRIRGELNVDALARSLDTLVARHPCLRTALRETVDGIVQVVEPAAQAGLEVVEAAGRTADERERSLHDLLAAAATQPFDLSRPPLLRALLVRMTPDDHVLLMVTHHIVTDGWSAGIVARDLRTLYAALSSGREPSLPAPVAQYIDHAAAQRRRLDSPEGARDLAYWREQLAGLEPLELPRDRPAHGRIGTPARTPRAVLPASLVMPLKALAQRERATLFTVMLAAYQVLVMRLSGREDFAVGTPVTGRPRSELEDVVGYFVNPLVVRTDLSGNPPFRQLLGRSLQTMLDAFEHQQVPFERLVSELAPERHADRNPLFDVMINFMDGDFGALELPGLDCQSVERWWARPKFAMTLYAELRQAELHLTLTCRSDLFSSARAEEMLRQYVALLGQIVAEPDARVHAYSLVTDAARRVLPDPVCRMQAEPQVPVHEAFLEHARRAPGRIALDRGDGHQTYAELAARSSATASLLRERAVGRGDIVAIQVPSSPALVQAMLAVLMSGAAFLVLDPTLPLERRRTMVRECAARLLLAPDGYDVPAEYPHLEVVRLGEAWRAERPDEYPADDACGVDGDDPAYVFFTSGSTGTPKAVLGRHKSLAHFLAWQRRRYEVGADDRVSQLIGLSFDPLLRDVFLPLTSGATLCLPEAADLPDPIAWLRRERVTLVHSTPAVVQSWLARPAAHDALVDLRWLFLSGEPLNDALVGKWRSGPGRTSRMANFYGPTETTMIRCVYDVPDDVEPGIQPIGAPIPQSQALVIDAGGGLCGIGEPGEIALRTAYSTLGYLNLPEENRRRFRPNPFGSDPSDLVYFTGDRGRYRPDGLLEICGRLDDQVKIRGVRVEPGEVAATLARHERVRECAVVARPNPRGEPALVAYYTSSGNNPPDALELRRFLRQRVMRPMVPGAWCLLDALPLLPNGKVDRKALPAPDWSSQESDYVEPRSELERSLAAIWREILDLPLIGVNDDFFDLGGDSLAATRALARANAALGANVALRALFEAPTVAELAARIEATCSTHPTADDATTTAPEILPSEPEAAPPILPRAGVGQGEDEVPLVAGAAAEAQFAPASAAQEALWAIEQLAGPSGVYNIASAARFTGELDVAALRSALEAFVERHAALRTAFEDVDGAPVQRVLAQVEVQLPVIEPDPGAGESIQAAIDVHLQRLFAEPFDLARAPLFRVQLLRVSERDHVLMFVVHHIVADGWSMGILARELPLLYGRALRGEPLALPAGAPRLEFADYALWERRRLAGGAAQAALAYWRERLAGLEPIELPNDRPRPRTGSLRGRRLEFSLGPRTLAALKSLARARRATLHMVLLAAFQTLLMRYTGQRDFGVGTPVAGRGRPELEGVFGMFVNMLVMRTDLDGDPTFVELLERTRATALEAYAHQELPFERIVAELNPQREVNRNPLFQVSFALWNVPPTTLALPGLDAASVGSDAASAKFDLSLTFVERSTGLDGSLEYAADLFDEATIERMAGHLCNLVEGMIADPQARLSQLPLMDAAERERLLVRWNDTARDYPLHLTLHQLFEQQAERTPGATAVVGDDQRLDYDALNCRANQLAHRLRRSGVGPDVLVGLCMERSVAMIVGMLAILKAGGAYVPIDADYPAERIAFMLADSNAPVILTQRVLAPRMPSALSTTLCVDDDPTLDDEPRGNLPPLARPEHLAYVIYTSGSTGRPKGVMIPHRGVVNHTLWVAERLGMSTRDRVLQKTSISFDASLVEIFPPLSVGASVVLARPGGEKDPEYLAQAIAAHGVTLLQVVPSALRALLLEPALNSCTSLRYVIAGGEALDPETARGFSRCLPRATLGNFYGPTEASVDATSVDVAELAEGPGPVPIGRPIANARLYVLDAHMQPVPVGAAGELYVGGAGVGRGYLSRPELTAERFLHSPFVAGDRLYRTGDLVRWRPDGIVAFVGRTDDQIKIRGFRIELGEIESALNACEGVRLSVVLAREDRPGERRLVAYVEGDNLEAATLKAALKSRLPEFMVPAVVVALPSLPRLPNDKLDRKSLPAPLEDAAATASFAAPRTPLEEALAAIWAEVLGRERVGVHDDFFELGGHSLSATQVMARTRRLLGVELPLRVLFEAPTIAGLAAHVESLDPGQRAGAAEPVAPLVPTGALSGPLSSAQEALWIVEQVDGDNGSRYNVPVALRLQGPLQVAALRAALTALVRRHAALRTAFREVDGVPAQFVLDDDEPDFEIVDIGTGSAAAGGLYPAMPRLKLAAHEPFDLAAGRPLRAKLLRRSPNDHVLLLVAHHIVTDGLSTAIVERELGVLYEAALSGARLDAVLPPLPVSFLDYAIWSRGKCSGPRFQRQLQYWVSHLSGAPDHDLPFDRPRPATARLGAAGHTVAILPDTTRSLASLARRNGATPYMVLMSTLRVLLARYGAGGDVVVGTPNGGRDRAELEGLVGYFVAMQPMRSSLADDPTFVELLARVRRDTLDAWANRDVSFERIVAAVNPPREPGRSPLFQVTFAMEAGDEAPRPLSGLQAERVPIGSSRAKFDLSLSATLRGDRLALHFAYNRDLFDHATVERMGAHLRNLLDAVVAEPQARLSAIPMLDAAERERLVAGFNDSARDYPEDASLPQLFEEQVARTPQAVAIVCEDERLDYATLNRRANRLAHRLRRLGVGPDAPVGMFLRRGPEMIVAMLGILKAGGAYVPIDVDYPPERVAFMLADSAAAVTIVGKSLAPRLAGVASRLLCLDDDPSLRAEPVDNPVATCRPEHLAYLVYTSGSTGRPKGVMVPHRAVVRLVCHTDYVSLGPDDCIGQASNASFDAATFEIWGALLNGARVAVVSTETLLSAAALERQIARDRITTMFVTTALFNEHAARAPGVFHGLRELLFGGEAVDPEAVARVLRNRPPQRLLHVYGPTETTTFATWYEVPRQPARDRAPDTVPIGRPIANTTCHVLDETMQPVPIGAPGELYIGGPGLARGYLERPELTAERFVPDPFAAGQRLYRSGDRVRRLADGNIVFLGRNDEQVKLRGFRIELGEVRAALAALPGVAQSALLMREDRPGEHRLVAYLVWSVGAPRLSLAQLRVALAERLPSFMIPAAFVALDALPLTANGKLDRRALPAPPAAALPADDAPADAVERELREIWESVLNVRGISLDADFFELGGHSMLAVRVLAEVDRRMGRQLRTASFFEAPTIRRFAALLRDESAALARPSCVVTVQGGDGTRPLFFVSGWGGQLIILNDLAKAFGPHQTLHVLDTGVFGADESGLTVEAIAARMVEDLRRAQPTGPYRLAGYSMGGKIVHEIAQQLHRSGERVAVLAILDTSVSGWTQRRSAPVRVLLHLREALRMRPAQMLAYLGGRARWMLRHLLGRDRGLFDGEEVERTAVTLAMEQSARAVFSAWRSYQPHHYPGRVLLIRAEERAPLVGVVPDSDPTYGWGALSGDGVDLRSMYCLHNRMLHTPHVAELARILAEAIGGDEAPGASQPGRVEGRRLDRAAGGAPRSLHGVGTSG